MSDTETRADGETWEDYARRLERIIADQRQGLREQHAIRKQVGNRLARKRINGLERRLGKAIFDLDVEREAKIALAQIAGNTRRASTTTNAERSSPASKVSRVAEREEMSA